MDEWCRAKRGRVVQGVRKLESSRPGPARPDHPPTVLEQVDLGLVQAGCAALPMTAPLPNIQTRHDPVIVSGPCVTLQKRDVFGSSGRRGSDGRAKDQPLYHYDCEQSYGGLMASGSAVQV